MKKIPLLCSSSFFNINVIIIFDIFLEKIVIKPTTKKTATTLAPLLDTRIHKSDNTVVLSPLNSENTNENDESSSR